MRIEPASDRTLLVTFGADINMESHRKVRALARELAGGAGIRNLHPAYSSLLVGFDPLETPHAEMTTRIRSACERAGADEEPASRLVKIPVCYGGRFGPDLEDVSRLTGLDPERVVALHSGAEYRVYFLGFSPGFPYMGGLPCELSAPRLDTPRRSVPAGSVAIAGDQTGVYPLASPGGWRIIGRTPLALFDAARHPLTLLEMGDRVRFVPAGEELFTGAEPGR